jgi:hypothetical protein
MHAIKTAAVEEAQCDTVIGLKQALPGFNLPVSMTSVEHFYSKCLSEFVLHSRVI